MHPHGVVCGVCGLDGVVDAVVDEPRLGAAHLHHTAGALADPPSAAHLSKDDIVGDKGLPSVEAGGV